MPTNNNLTSNASYCGMTAMVDTNPEFVDDNCWFPDSGAINDVINELRNLAISSEYTGNGKIHMGNDIGLLTSHIGHTSFHSSSFPSNSRILHLKNSSSCSFNHKKSTICILVLY